KSCVFSRPACGAMLLSIAFLYPVSAAPTKIIRLRSQPIPPKSAKKLELKQTLNSNSSGLFLIQFSGPLTADARNQLAALGVDLLHYVPDDTFVARLHSVRLTLLQTLPFVQWIGEYRPELKVHNKLASRAISQFAAKPFGVTVILAPRASDAETIQ